MTADREPAGIGLARRAAERVDRLADPHVDEPDQLEPVLPACARQAAGSAADGPVSTADVRECAVPSPTDWTPGHRPLLRLLNIHITKGGRCQTK